MRKLKMLLTVNIFLVTYGFAQLQDTIIYHPETKNYTIIYTTKLKYALSSDGSMRPLKYKDFLDTNEVFVEKDTVVTVLFEPSTKIYPKVLSSVLFDAETNTYTYSYIIENGPSAEQAIIHTILEFGEGCQIQSHTTNIWSSYQIWKSGGSQLDNKWSWLGGGKRPGVEKILPGEMLGGFILSSTSLPTISRMHLQGDANNSLKFKFGYAGSPVSEQILNLEFGYVEAFVTKPTLAPSSVLVGKEARVMLDTLLSYTRQSVALGWLKPKRDDDREEDERSDDGIVKNIEKRIEKAKKELVKGDSVKARKELEKLVKKVEKIYKKSEEMEKKKRESEMTMTSEAYALLKYNAEYLINRLPGKKEK